MAIKILSQKVECLNPNTGGKIKIDKTIYDLFSRAIFQTLEKSQPLTYTQIVEGIKDCFKQEKTKFDGSIGWYAVTIKNDMQARGIMEVFTEKERKLHRIKN